LSFKFFDLSPQAGSSNARIPTAIIRRFLNWGIEIDLKVLKGGYSEKYSLIFLISKPQWLSCVFLS
jgi:hypothetical protein